jgi:soluble lytic murein transglycosylase-like protein
MNYSVQQIQDMIRSAALKYNVDPNLAIAVAAHESNFNPNAINSANRNGTKDWGVMQLNDLTVKQFGVQNPLDPVENIDAGVKLLGQLSSKYSGDTTNILWAYNAGSGSVSKGVMPSGVQSYIDWVNNYMGVSPDPSTAVVDTPSDSSPSEASFLSGSVSLFGYDVPSIAVAAGVGVVVLGLLVAFRD